jgi:hypothetical protein
MFSTYYGGSGLDLGDGLNCDEDGNILVSLHTGSDGLDTTNAYQTTRQEIDAYVAVLTPNGQSNLFGSYIGGSSDDGGIAVRFDSENNIILLGHVFSSDFPTLNSFQETIGGDNDCFISKISLDGTLLFSSYLGGYGFDDPRDIAVDSNDNIIIVGDALGSNFPILNAYQSEKNDDEDEKYLHTFLIIVFF